MILGEGKLDMKVISAKLYLIAREREDSTKEASRGLLTESKGWWDVACVGTQ